MGEPEHVKNGFFDWMDDVFGLSELKYHSGQENITSWDVYWYNVPNCCIYSYDAKIVWFGPQGLCGYVSVYHYAYDDNTLITSYGPFQSLEELKEDYKETGFQLPSA